MPNTCPNSNNSSNNGSSASSSSTGNCSQKNDTKPIGGYKDVVIIGNGPSGLCLSYFLSGHWPYWNKTPVDDEFLQQRLEYCHQDGVSLCEQDLEYLSDGLEGRSNNPVALLYDSLINPGGDLGVDLPSCLAWNYDPKVEIDHVVIGKGPGPGGSWNSIDGSQLTISPSKWMELADFKYSEWEKQVNSDSNAGLVFSSTSSHFSEDKSLLNANSHQLLPFNGLRSQNAYQKYQYTKQSSTNGHHVDNERVSMKDVRDYYRDYAKSKNLEKNLLNNATVTSVKRVCCPLTKLQQNGDICSSTQTTTCWEVTGLIDRREKKKASSYDRGELMEFRFICKHLVLANGATDLHNELGVKGENLRYILRSIHELEDKIQHDLQRLRKDPLLIVGSGLSAADAILLAQKYRINIIHVIRRSVHDPNLIFAQLPKNVYPEYHRVFDQMIINRYSPESDNATNEKNYVLYDQYQVKSFTSKRTVILQKINSQRRARTRTCSTSRQMHAQKQHQHHHQLHQRQLDECDEEDSISNNNNTLAISTAITTDEIEIKLSYACILIGYSPDLSFLPANIVQDLALNPSIPLDTKENPIAINSFTHESIRFKHLFAMGPLVGDNFIRFGTGGALAICARIWKYKKYEIQRALSESSSSLTKLSNSNMSNKLKKVSSFNISTSASALTEI